MARNRLVPTHLLAILMMGIAVFLLLIAWLLHTEILQSDLGSEQNKELLPFRNSFALIGPALISLSIGLITFQKWAILGFRLLFWLIGFFWAGAVYLIARESRYEAVTVNLLVASSILIYAALASGILFLSNTQLLSLFHKKQTPEENAPDILDQI